MAMNIRPREARGGSQDAEAAPADEPEVDEARHDLDEDVEEPDDADLDDYAPEEPMSEAFEDFLRRAAAEAAPADEPEAAEAGPSRLALALRCSAAAAHVLLLAAVFWASFHDASAWGALGDSTQLSTQLSTALSYAAGYIAVVAFVCLPAALDGAGAVGEASSAARLVLAAATVDLALAATFGSLAAAFAFPAPGVLAALLAALAGAELASVVRD